MMRYRILDFEPSGMGEVIYRALIRHATDNVGVVSWDNDPNSAISYLPVAASRGNSSR